MILALLCQAAEKDDRFIRRKAREFGSCEGEGLVAVLETGEVYYVGAAKQQE